MKLMLGLFCLLMSLQLSSSVLLFDTPVKLVETKYEKLFRDYDEHKVIRLLESGGSVQLAQYWVGTKVRRPKLTAKYIAMDGTVEDLDPTWFHSHVVYFMQSEQVLLTYVDGALYSSGFSNVLFSEQVTQ